MPVLSSHTTTYEFTLAEIKNSICTDMNLKPEAVKIEVIKEAIPEAYGERSYGTDYRITGVKVIIDNKL